MDWVLWVGLAAAAGSALPYQLAAASAGIVVVAMAFVRQRGLSMLAFGLLAAAFGAYRAHDSLAESRRLRAAVLDQGNGIVRCEASGRITSLVSARGDDVRFHLRVSRASCTPAREMEGAVVAVSTPRMELHHGDTVWLALDVGPTERLSAPSAAPEAARYYGHPVWSGRAHAVDRIKVAHGPLSIIDRARAHVRTGIQRTFPRESEAMVRALVLGESDLGEADNEAFRQSGLSHLLVVSGMHIVLVIGTLHRVLGAALRRIPSLARRMDVARIASCVAIPSGWAYGYFAGGGGSSLRAVLMTTFMLLAGAMGRQPHPVRALGLSTALYALTHPLPLLDTSFVLSLLATMGLMFLSGPIADVLWSARKGAARAVAESLSATVASTLCCAPLLAQMSPTLPLGSVLANLIAVPVGETLALPLCLLHAVLTPWPDAQLLVVKLVDPALQTLLALAHLFAGGGSVELPPPTASQLAMLSAGAVIAMGLRNGRRWPWVALVAGAILAIELAARPTFQKAGILRATFLNVGQGDSALVDLPDGRLMVIDTGGMVGSPVNIGSRVLAPELRYRRRDRVDVLVLTHGHPDHIGGAPLGVRGVEVRELWVPDATEAWVRALTRTTPSLATTPGKNPPIVRDSRTLCGTHSFGDYSIQVLSPCPTRKSGASANDNSLVLKLRIGERALLFTGDAEHETEVSLIGGRGAELSADVLKVGHHGSRTSTSKEFLGAVRPSIAIVSCGVRNRFGHPTASTISGLGASGAVVLRTDRHGSIEIATDGHLLDVRLDGERTGP